MHVDLEGRITLNRQQQAAAACAAGEAGRGDIQQNICRSSEIRHYKSRFKSCVDLRGGHEDDGNGGAAGRPESVARRVEQGAESQWTE
jgi:hypothetical protein